jgi:hypothetical protein
MVAARADSWRPARESVACAGVTQAVEEKSAHSSVGLRDREAPTATPCRSASSPVPDKLDP